jgi:hypothetical protein
MNTKILLRIIFLFFFQNFFITSSLIAVIENNQDLVEILNSFSKEIAHLKQAKQDVETKLAKIQKINSPNVIYNRFKKYTILTVGSEAIFQHFNDRFNFIIIKKFIFKIKYKIIIYYLKKVVQALVLLQTGMFVMDKM